MLLLRWSVLHCLVSSLTGNITHRSFTQDFIFRIKTVRPVALLCCALFCGGNVFYALVGAFDRNALFGKEFKTFKVRLWMMVISRFVVGAGTGEQPHQDQHCIVVVVRSELCWKILCGICHPYLRENNTHCHPVTLPDPGVHHGAWHTGSSHPSQTICNRS